MKMIRAMLQPNDALVFQQNRQGYSFLCNASPEAEKQFERTESALGARYVPVALEGRLTEGELRARHAERLGIREGKLKVMMDAYADKPEEWARSMAAVFVKTDALEGILQRNPMIGALKYSAEALWHERK